MDTVSKKIMKGAEVEQKMGAVKTTPISVSHRGGVISKAELSAQEKGQQLLEEAQAEALHVKVEADKMLAQVHGEMEKAKAKGYKEGKEEGWAELTEEVLKAKHLKEDFFSKSEPEVIKLVMAIAEKVIGKLVTAHKEAVQSIVRQALERSLGDKITVRMNPADLKRLQTEDLQFKDIIDRTRHLHFKEDETIQKGGCVVETEVGTIDAQLETQLKAIRKALGV